MLDKRNRLTYWDVAKGFVIILVVLGHIGGINKHLRNAIFSFHMPFFFIANAFFIKEYKIKECFIKSSKSLLLPYCEVCMLAAVISVVQNKSTVPDYSLFVKRIQDMFVGMSFTSKRFTEFESVGMMWFVICLFLARIIYVAFMRFWGRKNIYGALVILCFVSLLGMGPIKSYAYLPWSLDVAIVALPFMWFGDQLRRKEWMDRFNKLWIYMCVLILWCCYEKYGFHLEMAVRRYPGELFCLMQGIAGSILCVGFARWFDKKSTIIKKGVLWCGENSMILLGVHALEARFFPWRLCVFEKLPYLDNVIGIFCVRLVVILLVSWGIVTMKQELAYMISCKKKIKV